MENMLTIVLTPPHVAIADKQPLYMYIIFNAHGLGHYDIFCRGLPSYWGSMEAQEAAS